MARISRDAISADTSNTDLSITGQGTGVPDLQTGFKVGGVPANIPAQATQAALEAETNENTYAPPDLIKHNPGVSKGWVNFLINGTINASFNVSSVDDDGVGMFGVNWDIDFSSVTYSSVITTQGLNNAIFGVVESLLVGSTEIDTFDTGPAQADPGVGVHVAAYGDQ